MSTGSEEALRKARGHLRQASLEGLEATRALLQAAMLTGGRANHAADSWAVNLQHSLEDLIAGLRENGSFRLPAAVVAPLAAALEAEIKRWEQRSQADPEARLVLRAFLGLRELLWELGMRHDENQSTNEGSAPLFGSRSPARPERDRIQRFDIED